MASTNSEEFGNAATADGESAGAVRLSNEMGNDKTEAKPITEAEIVTSSVEEDCSMSGEKRDWSDSCTQYENIMSANDQAAPNCFEVENTHESEYSSEDEQEEKTLEEEANGDADNQVANNMNEDASSCDNMQLEERLVELLQKTDSFSRSLMGGLSVSPKKGCGAQASSKAASRSHKLTEAEEDDILLKEAESDIDVKIISKQPPCITGSMKGYQIEGLNWLYQLYKLGINGILADEMGLGKTLQTIAILGYLSTEKHVKGPHLIICPRSTLENWKAEIAKWCPIMRSVRFHGTKEERNRIFSEDLKVNTFDICLTTYEMVIKEKARLTRYHWTYLIMDEAHRIKNEKSVLSEVVRMFKPQRRLLITGTPLQNNLKELWALLNFLMPQLFDSSDDFNRFFDFSRIYANQQSTVVELLHKILRPFMLRRLKADVERDLPPKKEVFVFVGMSPLQKKIYAGILAKNIEVLNAMTGNKTQMLNILMQLRKCCNHPYLFDGVEEGPPYIEGPHIVDASGKMVILDKLLPRLKQEGSRVLLFSQMTRLLDIVDDYCRWKGYDYARIDGSTPGVERQEKIDEFNAPNSNKFIFLLSTRAGGLGINLATADIVILFDSDFNPQMDLQAMDRAHRIGQKKKVMVYRFVMKECVEERIIERARKKLMLESLVIQKGRMADHSKGPDAQELHEMIQFGAQEVYRSQDVSSVSNADIDIILAEAMQRTGEMENKLNSLVNNFDLSFMSLDGGLQMYGEQEGSRRDKKKMKLNRDLEFFDLGDRKTKWKGKLNEDKKPRKIARQQLTGWRAEIHGGYDFQFFDHKKLDELDRVQHNWTKWLEKNRKMREELEMAYKEHEYNEDVDESSRVKKVKIENQKDGASNNEICVTEGEELGKQNGDVFIKPPTLKELPADKLRRALHVIESHIGQHNDYATHSKIQMLRRCKDLFLSPSTDEFVFTKCNFNEALEELEQMLGDGRVTIRSMSEAFQRAGESMSPIRRDDRASPTKSETDDDVTMNDGPNSSGGKVKEKTPVSRGYGSLQRRASFRLKKKEWDLEEEANDPSRPMKFTQEMRKQKEKLISQGFINWNRTELSKLVNAIVLYGKDRLEDVWAHAFKIGNKSQKDVKHYAETFFERYREVEGGEKMMSRINKAELERGAILQQNEAILQNVEEQVSKGLGKPQDLTLPSGLAESEMFTEDEDKVLLWSLYEHGATAYDKIHVASRYYWYSTRGFFIIATKTLKMIEERCNQIVAAVEQEWLQREKTTQSSKSNSTRARSASSTAKQRETLGNHSLIISNGTITHTGSKSVSSSVSRKSSNGSRGESPSRSEARLAQPASNTSNSSFVNKPSASPTTRNDSQTTSRNQNSSKSTSLHKSKKKERKDTAR